MESIVSSIFSFDHPSIMTAEKDKGGRLAVRETKRNGAKLKTRDRWRDTRSSSCAASCEEDVACRNNRWFDPSANTVEGSLHVASGLEERFWPRHKRYNSMIKSKQILSSRPSQSRLLNFGRFSPDNR